MKFLKKKNYEINHFKAHKFRGKNFYKDFRKDDKLNIKNFIKLCTPEKIPCRICGSKKVNNNFLNVYKKYSLRECLNCGFIFPNINCKKIINYENKIYKNYDQTNLSLNETNDKKYRNLKLIKTRFDYCYYQNFKNKKKKVLEVGFGQGDFLTYLSKKKVPCFGIEYNKNLVQNAKKLSLDVTFGGIEKLEDNQFDLVVMFDVIEHFVDPIKTLKDIYKKMKKGALLIFYTPNIKSLGFELMHDKQNLIQPFYHLNFFSKSVLEHISKITNFKIIKFETFGLDLIDFFLMKEYQDGFLYTKHLEKEITIMQSVVDKQKCSNHLRVTFKK